MAGELGRSLFEEGPSEEDAILLKRAFEILSRDPRRQAETFLILWRCQGEPVWQIKGS